MAGTGGRLRKSVKLWRAAAVSDKLEIKKLITTDNFMAQFIVCGLAEDKRELACLFQLLIVCDKIS